MARIAFSSLAWWLTVQGEKGLGQHSFGDAVGYWGQNI